MDRIPRTLTKPLLALIAVIAVGVVQWAVGSALEETRQQFGWRWAEVGAAAVTALAPMFHFLIAAAAAFIVGWIVQILLRSEPARAGLDTSRAPLPSLSSRSPPSHDFAPVGQPADRIFLAPEITPTLLTEPYRTSTGVQAARVVAPYIGKWMTFSGRIENLKPYLVDADRTVMYLQGDEGTMLMFDRQWKDRIHIMQIGQQVKVIGRISQIGASGITLEACELV